MTRTHARVAGWGLVARVHPTSPQLSAGRLAHVAEESSNGVQNELENDQVETQVDDALGAIADVRRQLAEVPAEVVVTNHVMGLYELAAIHLSAEPPDLVQAALAIDAVACLVEGLGDRLGDDAATMRDALGNIRIAFVQIKNQFTAQRGDAPATPGSSVAPSTADSSVAPPETPQPAAPPSAE